MRVHARLRGAWPIVDEGPPRVAEVLPGVSLTLGELEPLPLPADLPAWEDHIVFAGHPPTAVKGGQHQDTQTDLGWPVSIFGSDLHDPATGAFVERRLHMIFRFDTYGGVATLASHNKEMFDSIVDQVVAVLLKAVPDWRTDDPATLGELYRGLTLEEKAKPTPSSGTF